MQRRGGWQHQLLEKAIMGNSKLPQNSPAQNNNSQIWTPRCKPTSQRSEIGKDNTFNTPSESQRHTTQPTWTAYLILVVEIWIYTTFTTTILHHFSGKPDKPPTNYTWIQLNQQHPLAKSQQLEHIQALCTCKIIQITQYEQMQHWKVAIQTPGHSQ
jgi:hypothetical protein